MNAPLFTWAADRDRAAVEAEVSRWKAVAASGRSILAKAARAKLQAFCRASLEAGRAKT